MESSDPILTANLYCSGLLDDVLQRAILPFWKELERRKGEAPGSVWTVRYSRCGEHLKVRIHDGEDERGELHALLAENARRCFEGLPPAEDGSRISRSDVPPIDAEDEAETDYPDRSLLWTRYRRSHVSLGGKPLLDDDRYAARFSAVLARGLELLLEALDSGDGISSSLRQRLLIKALVAGLPALGFNTPERAAAYFAYHRDWLLRFFVPDSEKEDAALAHFDQRLEAMTATLVQLHRVMSAERERTLSESPAGAMDRWRISLHRLAGYLAPVRDQPEYLSDPFAGDASFGPSFKALHGTANQLGLRPLDEAFVHHLLLHALGTQEGASS